MDQILRCSIFPRQGQSSYISTLIILEAVIKHHLTKFEEWIILSSLINQQKGLAVDDATKSETILLYTVQNYNTINNIHNLSNNLTSEELKFIIVISVLQPIGEKR